MKIFFLLISALIAQSAFSCTCAPKLDVKTAYKYYEIIIAAKVIEVVVPKIDTSISKDGSPSYSRSVYGHTIKLELISIYKGDVLSRFITVSPNSSNCEYHFKVGQEYLVYAWPDDGNLMTSICTRTSLLEENEDLSFLKRKYKRRRTAKAKLN